MKLKYCEFYNQFISMYFTCELNYFLKLWMKFKV